MLNHQIATAYPNGTIYDRFAVHIEADPDEEWQAAIECRRPGDIVIRYINGVEVDRR